MSGTRIKAVLFDLGDTLLNFGPVDQKQLFKKAGRLSYDYIRELVPDIMDFKPYLWKNLVRLRIRVFRSNLFRRDFDSLELVRKYGERLGLTLPDEHWREVNWLWYKPLAEVATREDDLPQTLDALREQDLKLGIVSNTFVNAASLDRHLELEEILDYFPTRLYSYQFPYRKPNKRIFFEGARHIGESPENILFVGDRLETDVKGARRAGMRPVLKKAYTNEGKKIRDHLPVIEKIAELPALIREING